MTEKKINQVGETIYPAIGAWTDVVGQQIIRLSTVLDEVESRQRQLMDQANLAVDELARLTKDSLAITGQLSTEWLQIARGTAERAGEFVNAVTR